MPTLYLIRHGQASFGAADYDALSDLGFRQARHLGTHLAARLPKIDRVWRGSMRRHAETAADCLQAWTGGVAGAAEVDPGFNEFDHQQVLLRYRPEWADRARLQADLAAAVAQDRRNEAPHKVFQAEFERAMARWYGGEHQDYDEPHAAFRSRVLASFDAAVAALGASETGLVFTSGGVISLIAQHLLDLPLPAVLALNTVIVNCSVSKVLVGTTGPRLLSLNEHGHFEGEAMDLLSYR